MLSYSSYYFLSIVMRAGEGEFRGTHQFDIGTHLSNLPDLHHNELVDLWIPCFVVTHCQ